jgi:hypothetical protein
MIDKCDVCGETIHFESESTVSKCRHMIRVSDHVEMSPFVRLTINEMARINVQRAQRWHNAGEDKWTPLEWAGAMCGEAGEAANFAKKIKRIMNQLPNRDAEGVETLHELCANVCKEVADTIIYGLLLMDAVGCVDPHTILREVFNAKSVEYGFPERW